MARQFEPFTPVILTWEDAYHETCAQHDSVSAALREYGAVLRKSIGYYIGECEKNGRRCVVIATDDDRKDENESLGGPFYCPIGMVINIEPLQRKQPPKKSRRRNG